MDTTDSPHSTIYDKPTIRACDNINAERNVSIIVPFFQFSRFTDSDNAKTLSLICKAAETASANIVFFVLLAKCIVFNLENQYICVLE